MGASGLMARGPPPSPAWVTYMRYAILGLSLVCLAMGAWSIAIFGGNSWAYLGSGGAGGLIIFVAVLTFIVYGGGIAVEKFAPDNFYRIGFLIGYIFSIIFWLSAWAWSASLASFWLSLINGYNGLGLGRAPSNDPLTQLGASLAVAAALGAVVWVMTIVNLVMFIKACTNDPGAQQNAELGNVKQQQAGYPAPQQYPAQPYAAQPQAYPQQAYPQQPVNSPYGQAQPYATQ